MEIETQLQPAIPAGLETLAAQTSSYILDARSANTRRAYQSDWRSFDAWCLGFGLEALPAAGETVALYLTARAEAGARVSTLERALAAVSQAHQAAGHPSPRASAAVKAVLRGIRRRLGVRPTQKRPLLVGDLWAITAALPAGRLATARDRALLLLGFSGALRRSELAALQVEDVRATPQGLEVLIRSSKTDQEGAGQLVGVPRGRALCPVQAYTAWLAAAGIDAGPVFRQVDRHGRLGEAMSPKAIAEVVKRCAARAGMETSDVAGHSLRAGLATQAALAGKAERVIMAQTRHRSSAVVRQYIRHGELWAENAADGIGL